VIRCHDEPQHTEERAVGTLEMVKMVDKVLLDPRFRRIANILTPTDLERLNAACEVIWAKDEPAPEDLLDEVRSELVAIITGYRRYADVDRFPKLRAVLEGEARAGAISPPAEP
jgi:hypothetical protein